MVIPVKLEQFWKELFPMVLIVSGNVMFTKFEQLWNEP